MSIEIILSKAGNTCVLYIQVYVDTYLYIHIFIIKHLFPMEKLVLDYSV